MKTCSEADFQGSERTNCFVVAGALTLVFTAWGRAYVFPERLFHKTSLGHSGHKTHLGFSNLSFNIEMCWFFFLCTYYLEVIRITQNWCRCNGFTGPVHLEQKWERIWTYLNIYLGRRKRWFQILFPLLPHVYQKARGIQQPWHNRASTMCWREGSSKIYSPIHLVQQLRLSSLQFPLWIPPRAVHQCYFIFRVNSMLLLNNIYSSSLTSHPSHFSSISFGIWNIFPFKLIYL